MIINRGFVLAEFQQLATWDAFENRGDVPGSDWVCPGDVGQVLDDVYILGGNVATDEDVMLLASGRRQHLGLTRSPEGYDAVQILDNETGEVVTRNGASERYAGVVTCDCMEKSTGLVASVLSDPHAPAILLPGNKRVVNVLNIHDSTETLVRPATHPDGDRYRSNRLVINPLARDLYVESEGTVVALSGARANVKIAQENGAAPTLQLALRVEDERYGAGQMNLWFDARSNLRQSHISGARTILALLGTNLEFRPSYAGIVTPVRNDEAKLLAALAEAVGFSGWTGFDLKLSAAALYAAMGAHTVDPVAALVPNA